MTDQLDVLVDGARQRYAHKRPQSARIDQEAKEWMPGGNTRSVLHFDPFPFRVVSAEGHYLTDVDGHTYVDLLGNYTAGLLGHSPAAIRNAIHGAMEKGWAMGATHEVEVQAARLVCQRFPSMDQVRFTNSGTEANLMAIGTAVHHTKRQQVVVFSNGYHGGVLSFGDQPGPMTVPHQFAVLPFNDSVAVHEYFAQQGDQVACVLVEPMLGSGGCIPPADGFLEMLRSLCDASGALLVFDEVMTSRLAPGGAQERFGVMPDMTTLGKYLAGGLSFGAFGGKYDVMANYNQANGGQLSQAGTFNNNILSMSAVVATLTHVLTPELITTVNETGDLLRESLQDTFAKHEAPLSVTGIGSLMNIHAQEPRWLELFFHDMLDQGWYLARRGFIALSLQLDTPTLDRFHAAVGHWASSNRG